jgi:D-arabinose 1-dehydrogenase-like Zn-dependent alcohol dehydrogenase
LTGVSGFAGAGQTVFAGAHVAAIGTGARVAAVLAGPVGAVGVAVARPTVVETIYTKRFARHKLLFDRTLITAGIS